MKLFWFRDEDGHYWVVIVANNEESAWKLLAANSVGESGPDSHITEAEAHEKYQLDTTCDLVSEGKVATIFPLECNFYLHSNPTQR